MFRKILNSVLDLFFPKKCLGCNRADTYLCQACFNKIEIINNNTCFFCGKITWQGKVCLNCAKENGLDRIISATEYKNPLIRDLIKVFKYHYVKELTNPLSEILIKAIKNNWSLSITCLPARQGHWDLLIVPIPLYGTRIRKRGFNQAELLAKEIANYFNLPLGLNILKRKIPTIPQVNIKDREKRKANIKNIFYISPEYSVKEKIIILVDDVITTGATLVEAGKVLKKSGAKEVWALTVAKG